jgi:hypothetical protein
MTPIDDDNNEIDAEEAARKKKKSGSGEVQDGFGGGKAGAGAGGGIQKLSSQKDKEVKEGHRHLVASELIDAIVEFFSELPMRASANLSVTWEKTKTNVKSFAVVNWIVEFGTKTAQLARTRQSAPDSRGLKQQKPGVGNLNPSSAGPRGTGQ